MPTSGPTLFDMERLCQKMPDFADRAQELPISSATSHQLVALSD